MKHNSSPQDNSRLFLALVWPKQLSSNPKPGYINSHKLTMRTMATLHSPQSGKKQNSQHRHGKTQPTDVAINNQPTSTSPQHTPSPNVMAGELTQEEKGKKNKLSTCVQRKRHGPKIEEGSTHTQSEMKEEIGLSIASKKPWKINDSNPIVG